jgi:ParB/RepB/Spo0J family partition protein
MKIRYEVVPCAKIRRQSRNPNQMTAEEFALLRASFKQFGFLDPLLVFERPDGEFELLDGHHRLDAAIAEGFTELPCVITDKRSKDAVDAIQLAMNRNRGRVRLDIAEQILRELREEGWGIEEMAATGFSEAEINDMLLEADKEADKAAKSKPKSIGDVLGESGADRPWTLELKFTTQAELTEVKRALKKASGGAKDESLGVLHLLRMQKEEEEDAV